MARKPTRAWLGPLHQAGQTPGVCVRWRPATLRVRRQAQQGVAQRLQPAACGPTCPCVPTCPCTPASLARLPALACLPPLRACLPCTPASLARLPPLHACLPCTPTSLACLPVCRPPTPPTPHHAPRGQHPVRLPQILRDQIVQQRADVGRLAGQRHGLLPRRPPRRVQARHQALGCGLLVAWRGRAGGWEECVGRVPTAEMMYNEAWSVGR